VTKPDAIRIGLLFSTSGAYATIGRAMLNGAHLALAEIAADAAFPFRLVADEVDPGGRNAAYAEAAGTMLAERGLRHVVGCYTSSSRKEVLPLFEKHDALLWYPSHYEGFESSENVVYTGAAPNQHIVPLAEHLLRTRGRRAWCLGSNYIWAWENNKIMREAVLAAGGAILAERYLAVGETDLDAVVTQILDARPDFVFNTLIGTSAYAFFRRFRAAAKARGIDQAKEIPVASCSLAEPELVEIGPEACAGHISSSVYFASIESPANRAFVRAYGTAFPEAGPTSADAEASYLAVHLLARALRQAGGSGIDTVRAALPAVAMTAPQGQVRIDPDNRHSYLTPRIGISNERGGFDIIYEAERPVRPDPYLVWQEARPAMRTNVLRLVR
jgi:branched-chain amino acid transport system substrate-binding protein